MNGNNRMRLSRNVIFKKRFNLGKWNCFSCAKEVPFNKDEDKETSFNKDEKVEFNKYRDVFFKKRYDLEGNWICFMCAEEENDKNKFICTNINYRFGYVCTECFRKKEKYSSLYFYENAECDGAKCVAILADGTRCSNCVSSGSNGYCEKHVGY